MKAFSKKIHLEALIRRRIKFVVEKGAMARLFKKGTHYLLQDELYKKLKLSSLETVKNKEEYDEWLLYVIESSCWGNFSRNGLKKDRWAYFAKLINIVIYEIVSNREIFSEVGWKRVRTFIHIQIDSIVMDHLSELDPQFPIIYGLKGMTKKQYINIQQATRKLAKKYQVPPIWFEAAWSI